MILYTFWSKLCLPFEIVSTHFEAQNEPPNARHRAVAEVAAVAEVLRCACHPAGGVTLGFGLLSFY